MSRIEIENNGRVLVGIPHGGHPDAALTRGYQIAKACDAELAVVHVLVKPHPRSWMLYPQRHASDVADAIAKDLETITSVEAWCDRALPEPLGDRYIVRRGRWIQQIAEEAARAPTRLIVVPAQMLEPRQALALSNDLDVPVLLARPRSSNSLVIAATDLRHSGYPVLNEAAELAPAMAARLLCVHNRRPPVAGLDPMMGMFFPVLPIATESERTLRDAAASVAHDAESVVTADARAADAILDVARAQDADLVVVGAPRHHSIYRWLTGSTAAAVARRARRSVLVTPIEARPS